MEIMISMHSMDTLDLIHTCTSLVEVNNSCDYRGRERLRPGYLRHSTQVKAPMANRHNGRPAALGSVKGAEQWLQQKFPKTPSRFCINHPVVIFRTSDISSRMSLVDICSRTRYVATPPDI